MAGPVKIVAGAAQIDTHIDLNVNLDKIETSMRQASRRGCNVLLFHEGCLTGYPDDKQVKRLDFDLVIRAEKKVQRLAKRLGMAVLLGSTSSQGKDIFNDVMIVDENGSLLGRYAKTWRAGEPWYSAGSGPVIFRVVGVDATVLICHDLRYPELTRLGVAAGAQIVFIANNEAGLATEKKLLGYRSMQISRATENLVYSVMANAPAVADAMNRRNSSHGNSKIVDPLGNVLDEAGSFEERLVLAELDLDQASRESALRTIGKDADSNKLYDVVSEHPAYADWIKAGLKMVRRLNGK